MKAWKAFHMGFLKNRTYKKYRRIAAGLAAALLLAAGVRTFLTGGKPQEDGMDELLNTAVIEKRDLLKSVSVTGVTATADGRAGNTGLTNLKVKQVHVKVGDEVQEGDVICTFDSTLLEESLAAARNNYEINRKLDAMGADYEKQYQDSVKQADKSLQDSRQKQQQAEKDWQEASGKEKAARAAADKAAAALNARQAEYEAARKAASAAAQAYEDRQQAEYELARQEALKESPQEAEASGQDAALAEAAPENGSQSGQDAGAAEGQAGEQTEESSPEKLPERTPVTINDIDAYLAGLDVNGPVYTAMKDTLDTYSAAKAALEAARAEAGRTREVCEQVKAEAGQAAASREQARTAGREAQSAYESSIKEAKTAYQKSRLQSRLIPDNDARKQISQYEEQLEDYTVRAPMNGVITALSVNEGQNFAGGSIYEIQDLKHFIVEASVDEYDVVRISQGMTAYVKTSSMGEELLKGTVTYVAPVAGTGKSGGEGAGSAQTGSGGSAVYQIQITIEGEQDRLRPGMTAKISIVQEEKKGVLAVPYDCVETKEDGTKVIYVMEDGQKKETVVEKGMEADYYAEIKGEGLKEGMTVYLPEGMKEGGQLPEEDTSENMDDFGYGF